MSLAAPGASRPRADAPPSPNSHPPTPHPHPTLHQDAFADCGGPPPAFRDTLRWLSSRGLRVPDLLSSPPDVRKVELLRRAWDQGQSPLRFTGDAVAVAGSLRLWLACLPEPVLPARLYHPLLAASSLEGGPTRVRALQSLLRQVRMGGRGESVCLFFLSACLVCSTPTPLFLSPVP